MRAHGLVVKCFGRSDHPARGIHLERQIVVVCQDRERYFSISTDVAISSLNCEYVALVRVLFDCRRVARCFEFGRVVISIDHLEHHRRHSCQGWLPAVRGKHVRTNLGHGSERRQLLDLELLERVQFKIFTGLVIGPKGRQHQLAVLARVLVAHLHRQEHVTDLRRFEHDLFGVARGGIKDRAIVVEVADIDDDRDLGCLGLVPAVLSLDFELERMALHGLVVKLLC